LVPSIRAASYTEGDSCVVIAKEAALQKGNVMCATVTMGTQIKVLRVEGEWVRTAIQYEGKTVEGWIESGNLALCASVIDAKTRYSSNFETVAKVVALPLEEKPENWGKKKRTPR
jgi:hypothetical protein